MNITPNLLAANMMDRIKLVLPKENGLGNGSFSGTHIANLLMTVIYKDFEFKEQALELSEKELSKKIPEYVKCWIKCMRAIALKNYSSRDVRVLVVANPANTNALVIQKTSQKSLNNFIEANKNNPKLLKYINGLNVLRPTLIFAGIYYGILPMFSTYIADKIDKKDQ